MPTADSCLNCGEPLKGEYCHLCGQKTVKDDSFVTWISEAFESITDIDSRATRTLLRIVPRPGEVAGEYVSGKRQSFVHPLRLFVVVSAVVIPVMVFTGWFEKIAGPDAGDNVETLSVLFPALNLFSPFVAAFVLKLLVFRKKVYHHLVFALYFSSGFVILGIPLIFYPTHVVSLGYQFALLFGYSFFAIHDFYKYTISRSLLLTIVFVVFWQLIWQMLVMGALAIAASA